MRWLGLVGLVGCVRTEVGPPVILVVGDDDETADTAAEAPPEGCPWSGAWVVDAGHCGPGGVNQANGWRVDLGDLAGAPGCLVTIDSGICAEVVTLAPPNGNVWDAVTDGACGGEPGSIGRGDVVEDGSWLQLVFFDEPPGVLAGVFEGCPDPMVLDLVPYR